MGQENELVASWSLNALRWQGVVDEGRLASRLRVTNRAILEAVLSRPHSRLLDLGCGEGWLARELQRHGCQVVGCDVSPELIERARSLSSGEFVVAGYEDLAEALKGRRFEAVVANFSLLGQSSVEAALGHVARLLEPQGRLWIQTMHPLTLPPPYVDGWRSEDWRSLDPEGWVAMPWYFRTLESWWRLLEECGFQLVGLREPRAEGDPNPSSLLLELRPG